MEKQKSPLIFGLLWSWLGIVLSVSFIETPIKFRVPEKLNALILGKLMFRISTYIQFLIIALIILNMVFMGSSLNFIGLVVILTSILLLQNFWLMPKLYKDVNHLLLGESLSTPPEHKIFIISEAVKFIVMLLGIFVQFPKRVRLNENKLKYQQILSFKPNQES